MTPFAVAGIQMHISATESNIPTMKQRLETLMALYPWVDMVMFSELCASGPLTAKAQPLPGPAEAAFQEMAAHHKVWLLTGSMFERVGEQVYNTASVIDPGGQVVGRYRKMFPFRPFELGVSDGSEFVTFDVPDVGKFGVSICYDMWFPEVTRTLAVMGAEVILHPSLTGTIDREAELAIVRASAATNQCYFFNVNGLSAGGNGRSIVCGPDGEVVHQEGTEEALIPIEIDLDRVRRSRDKGMLRLGQTLKSFRDRSVDFSIYGAGLKQPYLESLGPLTKPSRADKDAGVPRLTTPLKYEV